MTRRAGILPFLLLWAMTLLPAVSACTPLTTPDPILRLYPAAEARSSGPFLAIDDAARSASDTYEQGDIAAGLLSYPQSLQGNPGLPAVLFTAKTPIPANHYLNLSSPIRVVLWTSSEFQDTSGATPWPSSEHRRVRVELLVDGALAGGAEFNHNHGRWGSVAACFRPEVRLLPQDGILAVRVTFLAAQTNIRIGTGGAQQSFLELSYYRIDPLAAGVYRNGTRLELAALEGGAPSPASAASPHPALLLLPLAAPFVRSNRRAVLAMLLAASLAFAGCAGKGGSVSAPEGTSDGPKVSVTYEPGAGSPLGLGRIEGRVVDAARANASIPNANVLILDTNFFSRADKGGNFRFEDVPPRTYDLVVDAPGYEPVHEPIAVLENQTTRVTVPLRMPSTGPRGFQPHDHGEWGDAVSAPFQKLERILPTSQVWVTNDANLGPYASMVLGDRWVCSSTTTIIATAGYETRDCQTPLRIDTSKVVKPGADRIEVRLKWDTTADGAPRELGLWANSGIASSIYVPRPPNVPFNLVFYPNEADPGHQKFTNWQFALTLAYPAVGTKTTYASTARVDVEMTQYRGVVPIEPPHREFWGNQTRLALIKPKFVGSSPYTSYPAATYSWAVSDSGAFVPPGTREIVGWLNYTANPDVPPALADWGVRYRPADRPASLTIADLEALPRAPSTANGKSIQFRIDLSTPEAQRLADQFYQPRSYWQFYLDDGKAPAVGGISPSDNVGRTWTLDAYAFKDPQYDPD